MKITGAQHDSSLVTDTLKSNEDTLPEALGAILVSPLRLLFYSHANSNNTTKKQSEEVSGDC